METGHDNAPARRVRLDCKREQGGKRFKADPDCLGAQAGAVRESEKGISLEHVKQEPSEQLWHGCEGQWQPLLKVMETPSSEEGHLELPGQQAHAGCSESPLDVTQQLRGSEVPQLQFGSIKDPQDATLATDKTVKDEFPGEVGHEEVILGEEAVSWDTERQKFREFIYYEAVGPRLTSYRLWTLCRQWLQPEKRTKEQILEQVILEQFLAILPQEMRNWVKQQHPDSCPRAVALAEGFLLLQEQKATGPLQKVEARFPKVEDPPLDSCQRSLSGDIKQEDDSDPSVPEGSRIVSEVKEENLSKEDTLTDVPGTAGGSAPGSISSPSKSVLLRLLKEEPGTICDPSGGTVRKIKEENLSDEDSLVEAPLASEGRAQRSISSPNKSALVKLPKEERGTTCKPSDGSVRQIKEENMSQEDSLVDAPAKAEGHAQWNVAFPSGSASVGLLKGEPGTTCHPDSLSSANDKTAAVKVEEKPGKSGEGEPQGAVLGGEEESKGTSGQMVAGEREEVWTGYGKTFRWKSVLTPCKETVTDWKIYQCCACGKNYDARSIRAHQKMHTGEKLYECIYCGRTFSQRAQFESHEKIHTAVKVQTRENLYICVTCGKSFAYYSTLVAHKRTHGDDDSSVAD
ncbi:zinc finger protein 24-like [Sphaerodactylus townsendi]|uniref:zinc finger protein 24-like n=1 Tax=Sphaerodactylus townsendi TaxID=933632 RepID=UPI002026E635|nr:zinc finger protein 24-like [Sphaerodactylus townsendi]XP_048345117.1 zinc finger protein 24-like [Sphaerodactylus townsendi]